MIILFYFLAGLIVEFVVCRFSRKSRNQDIWRMLPIIILVVCDFLYCVHWGIQDRREFHEQGNCIGVMLYVIGFFGILIPPLTGIGVGRLAYWVAFEI